MESVSIVRRRRVGTLAVLMGLLGALFAVLSPPARAADVPPGTVGTFEIDGDQQSLADEDPPGDEGNTVDWVDFASLTPEFDDDSLTVHVDAVGPDNGLQGSSDENDPESFACQPKDPTVTPGKDNIVRAYFNTRVTDVDSMFLDLAFVRDDGGTQGDSHMNFEFNQNPITNLCPYTGRSEGDILIAFDFPGNSASPAGVTLYTWDPTVDESPKPDGAWVPFSFSGAIAADDNVAQINDEIVGGTIAARAFGEASLDLFALIEAAGGTDGCASFGFASVRSRSSGQTFNSALQDILGGPVDITTCGTLIINKTDDAGNPLAGATFGLWPADVDVPEVGEDGTRPDTGSIATCPSLADGTCTFDAVDPGDYQVAELTPPEGYDIDPDVVDVTVGFRDRVEVEAPFVDPLDTGFVEVTKALSDNGEPFEADPADLEGLTFILEQGGTQVNTWPPPGDPAECSLDGVTLSCEIGPVPLGDYTVTEDPETLPPGVSQGPDVNVTIDEDGETVEATITNPLDPIDIDLDKTGDTLAHVGDTIDYDFTVTNNGSVDLINVELTDPECDEGTISLVDDADGNDVLAVGEVWTYTCERTITEEDVVVVDGQDFALNTGEVTAEDERGRSTDDTDPHEVLIITPDIEIVKTVDDDTPAVGQTVTFTYVVTNTGNTTLFGIDVVDDQLGPIGTIDELAPGESATLTKTMVVAEDSPTVNVAVADGEDVLGKHVDDDDDAEITIVAGEVIVQPEPEPLPATGADIDRYVLLAAALLLVGGALLITSSALAPAPVTRRRRQS